MLVLEYIGNSDDCFEVSERLTKQVSSLLNEEILCDADLVLSMVVISSCVI